MKASEYNAGILERLIQVIDEYIAGSIELDEVQGQLQAAMSLRENDGSGAQDLVRLAEADIEGIQFTMLRDEQRPAAVFRLDALREAIRDEGEEG